MADLSVVYCVMARGSTPLAEWVLDANGCPSETRTLLQKLPNKGRDSAMVGSAHSSHFVRDGAVVLLCVLAGEAGGEKGPSRQRGLSFLSGLREALVAEIGPQMAEAVQPFALNAQFLPVVARAAKRFSAGDESLQTIKDSVDLAKERMIDSMGSMIDRGAKMESLLDKTEEFQANAQTFKQSSVKLRRAMYCRRIKFYAAFAAAAAVLLLVLVALGCNGFGKGSKCG